MSIDLNVYKFEDNLYLLYYGATWCSPCKKIKPIIEKHFNTLVYSEKVPEEDFKENSIPYFIIASDFLNHKNFKMLSNFNTKDPSLLLEHTNMFRKIETDENF